ncbi:uncharacterized protein [Nothobranchius furzeri]|uniref:uncharacterized protein isoform X3 n=1 Tax=Nothobranchius furzeri TaxID=105023 RepID=UPI003904937F
MINILILILRSLRPKCFYMALQEQRVTSFVFLTRTDSSFRIQVYRNTELQQQTKAVMLYSVDQDEKVMVVCCRTDTEVCPEAMNLADLQNIKDSGHKAMFFMTNLKNDTYMFESTLHKGKFLSFEPSQDSCLHKLILHPYEVDDTDHTINMIVSKEK